MESGTAYQMVTSHALVFSFMMALAVNFVLEVNRLLGPSALANFLLGTYFRPREEDRVFVLLDLADSTGIAERIGAVGYHRLLNGAFGMLTPLLLHHGGDVHKYVGDEVIVTWVARPGAEARALAFAIDAIATIAEHAEELERRYGAPVGFRAAVHKGRVIAGELGDFKREIALLGDPLNVAARLLQEARERGATIVASGDVLAGAALPEHARTRPLGLITPRGRSQPLELFELARA
jgi:adenylate cyclase